MGQWIWGPQDMGWHALFLSFCVFKYKELMVVVTCECHIILLWRKYNKIIGEKNITQQIEYILWLRASNFHIYIYGWCVTKVSHWVRKRSWVYKWDIISSWKLMSKVDNIILLSVCLDDIVIVICGWWTY